MKNFIIYILIFVLLLLLILKFVIKLDFFENENIKKNVIIAGCARDCSKYLPKVLNKIKELSKNKNVYYIFYENNSKDNTLELLQNFVNNKKNAIVITENLNIKRRTPRIAHCRNQILKHIFNNDLDKKYQYFINLDLDNVNENLDIKSVNRCLNESNLWDIASINQKNYYYDLWALRTKHKNNNCWNWDICFKTLDKWFPNIEKLKKKKKINTNLQYIPVLSAFGGLTIYKTYLLRNNWYSGEDKNKSSADDCEHVNFHIDILNKYPKTKFYIIPYMTND